MVAMMARAMRYMRRARAVGGRKEFTGKYLCVALLCDRRLESATMRPRLGTHFVPSVQRAPPRRWHATAIRQDAFVVPTPPAKAALARKYWTKQDIKDVYDAPLLELVFRAATVHRAHNDPSKIQLCTLMNIKSARFPAAYPFGTNAHTLSWWLFRRLYDWSRPSPLTPLIFADRLLLFPILPLSHVHQGLPAPQSGAGPGSREKGQGKVSWPSSLPQIGDECNFRTSGSTRFCMGAAWRTATGRPRSFKNILEMVREIRDMGMEVRREPRAGIEVERDSREKPGLHDAWDVDSGRGQAT
jgi:hypothetical protein